MKIVADYSHQKEILKKKEGNKVYCTVDGIKQEVVYTRYDDNQDEFYENVRATKERRLRLQQELEATPSTTISKTEIEFVTTTNPNGTTTTTEVITKVFPVFSFSYSGLVKKSTNNRVTSWISSLGAYVLSQSTEAKKPYIGYEGSGVVNKSAINFDTNEPTFMSFDRAVTLSGDFTLLIYLKPIKYGGLQKRKRIFGKSDDANMFLSIGESANKSYRLQFTGSNKVEVAIASEYWNMKSEKVMLTLVRKGSNLIIRENQVEVYNGTVSTDDFVFDQVGRAGTEETLGVTLNASVYHLGSYKGAIVNNLLDLEKAIITNADKANPDKI